MWLTNSIHDGPAHINLSSKRFFTPLAYCGERCNRHRTATCVVMFVCDTRQELDYPCYRFFDPVNKLPLQVNEADGPNRNDPVGLTVQIQSPDELHFIFMGGTWAYRTAFNTMGVGGSYQNPEAMDKGLYLRVLRGINASNAADKTRVIAILGDAVLNELAMSVRVEGTCGPEAPVSSFIEELRGRTHLHFEVGGDLITMPSETG